MAHLGNNIARIRGFKRLTQKELASKLNMRQQDYSKIENSEEIDNEMLELISNALDIPIELIKQLDGNSAISLNQQGGNTGNIFYQVNPIEKIETLYERLLEIERKRNDLLEEKLRDKGKAK